MHSGRTRSHRKTPPCLYLPPFTFHSSPNSKKVVSPGSHTKRVTFTLNPWGWGRTSGWRLRVRLEDTLCKYRLQLVMTVSSFPHNPSLGNYRHVPQKAHQHPHKALLPLLKTSPASLVRGKQPQRWVCYIPSTRLCLPGQTVKWAVREGPESSKTARPSLVAQTRHSVSQAMTEDMKSSWKLQWKEFTRLI